VKRYLYLFIGILVSAVLINQSNQWLIFIPLVLLIFLIDQQPFHIFLKWKFNLLVLNLLLGIPLILGKKDSSFFGIPYSQEYFQMSLVMINRSILILLGIKMLTNKINIQQIGQSLHKIRLQRFSEVFSTALRVLPEVKVITHNTYREFKRTPRDKNIMSHLYDWLVKLTIRILYFADQYYLDQLKHQKQE
jgi:energy-coupling factor transporter transmembrane protein EcfT